MVCSTGSRPSAWPSAGTSKLIGRPGSTAIASGSAIEATDSAPPRPPDGHSLRATANRVAPSASVESSSTATHATTHGTTAIGTITIAANGG